MGNSILDRYGIKEVADVTFYELDGNGNPTNPVLYLDTLKVSTIEQTSENSDATGGKGNGPLVSWDFGKEITVNIEDALFSAKSMAIMFGNGKVKSYAGADAFIMKTEQFVATNTVLPVAGADASGWKYQYEGPDGKLYVKLNPKFFTANGTVVTSTLVIGEKYFCTFDIAVKGSVIDVSANTFPGTYYVTGDTFARSDASGKDEFFQFILPKAKVQSENTLTLEADGDPSVFNLSLKVLRPADGVMMKLVQYDALNPYEPVEGVVASVAHNHVLNIANGGHGDYSMTIAQGDTTGATTPVIANASTATVPDGSELTATVVGGAVTIKAAESTALGQYVVTVKNASATEIAKVAVTVVAAAG